MQIEPQEVIKKIKYQRPRGTQDIIGDDFKYFDKILKVCKRLSEFYGFKRIETPILETANLFIKGIGRETDVIGKEMYFVKGEKKNVLALRPEGTASIIRAYIEHGMDVLPKPVNLWYFGPFFRHEKPQSGRLRQFWQFGFEVLGRQDPVVDAQTIQLFVNILDGIGIKNVIVHINSIGCLKCRSRYIKNLKAYLIKQKPYLCADCKRRLDVNPLRILDCKQKKCQEIVSGSPQILDYLCKKCRNHFKKVLEFLDSLGLDYELDPFLVRGLDYYNRTVFEIFPNVSGLDNDGDSENSNLALSGGGRYDGLSEALGGRETPACGGSAGIDRIIMLMKKRDISFAPDKKPQVFLAQLGFSAKAQALRLIEEFRKANIPIAHDFSRDSLRSQLSKANRIGVKYTLILGQKEVIEKEIILRDMVTKAQEILKLKNVIKEIKKRINH